MNDSKKDPLFGAAVLKMSFAMKSKIDEPGFRVVYHGTIKDLGLTDSQVTKYITKHRKTLEEYIRTRGQEQES
jgi:hypothetical protein